MTPNDCLLVAICFMAASLLIRVTEPVLDYIIAVIVVLLYYVLGGLFPFILLFLSCVGASLANFIYDDVESNRWKTSCNSNWDVHFDSVDLFSKASLVIHLIYISDTYI